MSNSNRRQTTSKESDPYKKVWNTVEDEEAELLSWVRNGTLFVPTQEELARRHASAARFLLNRAKKIGRSAEGIAIFESALFHRNMAKDLFDKHRECVLKSR